MRDILAPAGRDELRRFARSQTLVAFDFDGTLAPIVTDPDRAAMRPSTRRLLEGVARAYPCVVISGRSRDDVGRRLRGVPLAGIVGNHGLEPWHAESRATRGVRRWIALLRERLGAIPGLAIEDKGFSIAVHYRRCRDKEEARARVLAAAAGLGPARLLGGKQVLNILPAGAPNKGRALERGRACRFRRAFSIVMPAQLPMLVNRFCLRSSIWFFIREASAITPTVDTPVGI